MKNPMDLHCTIVKSTAAPVRRPGGLSLFMLACVLVSGAGLALPGRTGHSQNLPVQKGAVTPKVNVESPEAADQTKRLTGVTVKNGILAFSTLDAYDKNYPIIFNMSNAQWRSWEKSLGFVSQRNIFNQIVDAEYAYLVAPYERMSDAQLERMAPPRGHTAIYNKYLRSGLITVERDGQGGESYTAALPIRSYLPIINEQGYFMVGSTVYQIKGKLIKEMPSAKLSGLSVLDRASSDDLVNAIKVQTVVENPPASSSKGAANFTAAASCNYPLSSGWVTSGKRRGMITVTFAKTYWNPYPYSKVTIGYHVNVKSQKKNFWGTWVYPSCPNECWIDLKWTTVFDYMDKFSLGYAGSTVSPRWYSYPHPNCINDFNTSQSPITNNIAPYPSTFTFTAPSGLAFLDVSFKNALWHASVPGGSSGINCNVSCP